MKTLAPLFLVLCLFSTAPLAAEELSPLTYIELADIINTLEDRCPCVDIIESDEEERREDSSPVDDLEDFSAQVCMAKISNPGKFRQAFRYFQDLGVLQLEEGETLKSISSLFREARKDCKTNSNKNPNRQ